MNNFCKQFEGKHITVMGLGLLGRGIGDAKFLAECGAELLITDLKTKKELKDALNELKDFSNITYVLGEHRLEDFRNCDMVLKAAGIPLDSVYIEEARKHNVPVEMSGTLFAKLSKIPIIGVTGSRGKSTAVHLIHHVLTRATEGGEVLLGGNVRGVSNLQLLKEVKEDSLAVMELDSWQLQGFGEAKISPHIAIFTNFLPDHLNYYHGDMDLYFKDKAHIFLHQEAGDTLITTPEVLKHIEAFAKNEGYTFEQDIVLADASDVPTDWQIVMPGEHNKLNVALAIKALRATSLSDELIKEGIASFKGVQGRLQLLKEIDGVKIYNDNNATTPSATLVGLEALADGKNIILIMGGTDKGLDMSELMEKIPEYTKAVELLSGTGTEKIKDSVPEAVIHDGIRPALKEAQKKAKRGDAILFSPAFASFGMFKNEYDRGDQFVEAVNNL